MWNGHITARSAASHAGDTGSVALMCSVSHVDATSDEELSHGRLAAEKGLGVTLEELRPFTEARSL